MRALLTALTLCAPLPALANCPPVADPVISLNFESRYAADDATRSEIDPEAEADTKAALAVLDDFISDLSSRTDAALSEQDTAEAYCVMAALAGWAEADAMSDLGTQTVELTIAPRLSALALIAGQVAPIADPDQTANVAAWLARRMEAQMTFWETAPKGAASGNLRAWSALAGAAVAQLNDDPILRGWAAWSLTYVACSTNPDGSLPQEMTRKKLALHYQVHAVTPLTVGAALLEQQGMPVLARCNGALERIVGFTLRDLAAGGVESEAISGEPHTLNAGLDSLKGFQLSWAEAWLSLTADPEVESLIAPRRPLKYSKLGGDQTRIWAEQTD